MGCVAEGERAEDGLRECDLRERYERIAWWAVPIFPLDRELRGQRLLFAAPRHGAPADRRRRWQVSQRDLPAAGLGVRSFIRALFAGFRQSPPSGNVRRQRTPDRSRTENTVKRPRPHPRRRDAIFAVADPKPFHARKR